MAQHTFNRYYSYQGWFIDIIPETTGYEFYCINSSLNKKYRDYKNYPDRLSALIAGLDYVDRMIATLALVQLIDEWFDQELISLNEYIKVLRFYK